jgi:hypothetical protein
MNATPETSYIFVGFNTRQRRTVRLGYMARSAKEAWETCARCSPDLIVTEWGTEAHMR